MEIDSPVNKDSLTSITPSTTRPSTTICFPLETLTKSFNTISEFLIDFTSPSRITSTRASVTILIFSIAILARIS